MLDSRRGNSRGAAVALTVLFLFVAAASLAGVITGDPLTQRLDRALIPPFREGFVRGTDHLGRDLFARLVHGARSSLVVSVGSALIAAVIGTTTGILAAIDRRGGADRVLQLWNDSLLAFPTILMAIAVAAVLEPGRQQVMWTLGVVFSPVLFRVSRSAARQVIHREYYLVSRLLHTPLPFRTLLHMMPNVLPQVIVQSASLAAVAIGTEAALSFLGLGAQPPEPSWGLMLSDARRYLTQAPYLSIVPGVAAGVLAFSFQYLSDRMAGVVTALEQ